MGQSSLLRFIQRIGATEASCSVSDAELLERYVGEDDRKAFHLLVHRHGPMVWNVCRRALAREQDAEDAFQATFVVLAKKAAGIAKPELLGAWLFGVARRIALKARARTKLLAPLGDEDRAATLADPLAAISARELLDILDAELMALPEVYRAPLILCCLEGKSRDEAAKLLNWSLGSVKGRLERARQLLENRLTRRGITLSAALAVLTASSLTASAAPAALVSATVQAGLNTATIAPGVAALSTSACRMLMWETVRKWVFVAVALCLLGVGVGAGYLAYPGEQQAVEQAPLPPAPNPEPIAEHRADEKNRVEEEPAVKPKVGPVIIEGTLRRIADKEITIAIAGDNRENAAETFRLASQVEIQTPTGAGQRADLTRTKNARVELRLTEDRREVIGITLLPRKKAPLEKGKG